MDVVIARSSPPYIDGSNVFVDFIAIGKQGDTVLSIGFRVQYGWGATATQRETAIKQAANAAKQAYEEAHGVTLPTVNRLEIVL